MHAASAPADEAADEPGNGQLDFGAPPPRRAAAPRSNGHPGGNGHPGARPAGGNGGPITSFPFGDAANVPIQELPEKELDFYERCFKKQLSDPSKANLHARAQQQLDAVLAERTRRRTAA